MVPVAVLVVLVVLADALLATIAVAAPADAELERWFVAPGGNTGSAPLHILSTTDLAYFEPLVIAYQQRRPEVSIRYTVASSRAVFEAVTAGGEVADVVVSSAMDLQIKLVNDGHARAHDSAAVQALPDWATWRGELFAHSLEPVSLVVSRRAFDGLALPAGRTALIELLRKHPARFRGRIGTYDIRRSGAGYLFATQDARRSDAYWPLMQAFGELDAGLYCCSADMIDDVRRGRLALAYNVVGAYASASLEEDADVVVVPLSDFTHVLQRTVLIPRRASQVERAQDFVDFLIGPRARTVRRTLAGGTLLDARQIAQVSRYRPVALGPGLLVYLDDMKRERFLSRWGLLFDTP